VFELQEDDIEKLSKLCHIECTEKEKKKLRQNLSEILTYAAQLQEINTEGVAPCNSVLENRKNSLREDEIGDLLPRETFLNNAPSHTGGMIRVPPVIKF